MAFYKYRLGKRKGSGVVEAPSQNHARQKVKRLKGIAGYLPHGSVFTKLKNRNSRSVKEKPGNSEVKSVMSRKDIVRAIGVMSFSKTEILDILKWALTGKW